MGLRVHGGNDMEIVILLAVISTVLYMLRRYAVECFDGLHPLIRLLLSHEQGDGCFHSGLLRTVLRGCIVGENLSTVKYQCRFSGRAGGPLLVPPVEEFLNARRSSPEVVNDKPVEVFVIEAVVHLAPQVRILQSKVELWKS